MSMRQGGLPTAIQPFDLSLVEAAIALNRRGLQAAAETQRLLWRRCARIGEEWLRFIDRGLKEDREIALAGCGSAAEVCALCGGFVETAARRYAEAAATFTVAAVEGLGEGADEARRAFETTASAPDDAAGLARAALPD